MIRSMKVCAALLVVSLAATAMAGAADKRPNILFIIADDRSPFDFKTYNPASGLETPVLDKLAEGGMVFDGAYHMGSFSGAWKKPLLAMSNPRLSKLSRAPYRMHFPFPFMYREFWLC